MKFLMNPDLTILNILHTRITKVKIMMRGMLYYNLIFMKIK